MDDHQNTPSIIAREITSFRGGQRLAYGDLTGREKRDYLFDAGIRATAYANKPGGSRPDVRQGLLQFTASALNSIAHHLLDEAREATLLKTGAADLDELIPHAERIGTVTTESEFIASKYGTTDCSSSTVMSPCARSCGRKGGDMAHDVSKLRKMSPAEIDTLFADSPPDPIPNGEAEGTAIVFALQFRA